LDPGNTETRERLFEDFMKWSETRERR
jgi:hypothetical protein